VFRRTVNLRDQVWNIYKRVTHPGFGLGIGRRLPALMTLHRAIARRIRTNVAVVDGHRLHLMAGDREVSLAIALTGRWEPLHTMLAKREIKPGDVVLDLGANIGYFTLLFARLVGPSGKVYAFEPAPDTFAVLARNVEENGYTNVTLVAKAVSNVNGHAQLTIHDDNPGINEMAAGGADTRSARVDTVRLDDYLAGYQGRIDFIKMDIEGMEPFALEGMQQLLDRNPQVKLLTEFISTQTRKVGGDPEVHLRQLLDRGFDLFRLDEDIRHVDDPNELLAVDTRTNLYCVPRGPTSCRRPVFAANPLTVEARITLTERTL
jgi:FkbM family methyltransferase